MIEVIALGLLREPHTMPSRIPTGDNNMNLLAVETTLCVWEHMLETRRDHGTMHAAWCGLGEAEMRHYAIKLGSAIDAAFTVFCEAREGNQDRLEARARSNEKAAPYGF